MFEVWFLLDADCFRVAIKLKNQGWRDGSGVKSACYFAEDASLFSSIHVERLTSLFVSSSRGSDIVLLAPSTFTHMHMCT